MQNGGDTAMKEPRLKVAPCPIMYCGWYYSHPDPKVLKLEERLHWDRCHAQK
jgi:hypothetical protein